MSAQERIQKLEGLLARINARAAEPRPLHAVAAAPAVHHAPAPVVAPIAAPVASPVVPRVQTPPPMRAVAASAPEIETGEEYIDDMEVSTEVVEVDVDEGTEAEIAAAAAEAESAAEEEAPVSSKRPIADEEAAEEEHAAADAYAAEPPRHTPPPESGRQVAASPVPPPHSARVQSEPPPAPAPLPPPPTFNAPPRPGAPSPMSQALQPPPSSFARPSPGGPAQGPAQIMRPQIGPSTEVAKIEGEAPAAEASSFGDLLDDSLSI